MFLSGSHYLNSIRYPSVSLRIPLFKFYTLVFLSGTHHLKENMQFHILDLRDSADPILLKNGFYVLHKSEGILQK